MRLVAILALGAALLAGSARAAHADHLHDATCVRVPGHYETRTIEVAIPGRWVEVERVITVPGRYETRMETVTIPGRWETVTRTVWDGCRWRTVCEQVWIPPRCEERPVQVWVPPCTRTVVERVWQPGCTETRTVQVWVPARYECGPAPPPCGRDRAVIRARIGGKKRGVVITAGFGLNPRCD